jgi:hypothetical protein
MSQHVVTTDYRTVLQITLLSTKQDPDRGDEWNANGMRDACFHDMTSDLVRNPCISFY